MKVVTVVLNWNGLKYIEDCLRSLQKLSQKGFTNEVVVVDNASTDDSVVFIKKHFSKFTLLENDKNLGYAAGNNVGIQYALDHEADFVWIVNPDVQVSKDALERLIEKVDEYPKAAIFGSKIYFAPGYEFHKERYTKSQIGKVIWYAGGTIDWRNMIINHTGINEVDSRQFDHEGKTEFVTGASMLVRAQALQEIGLLDDRYYLYYEETDLCQRAAREGWSLVYIPSSIVWHANAQATGTGSDLVDYYTTRNRLLFGVRWAPIRTKIALLRESVKLLISGRSWQKRGVRDFYTSTFGKGSFIANEK